MKICGAYITGLLFLNVHLCFTEAQVPDGECERYGKNESFSTRAYFTECIKDSGTVTLSPAEDCREIGPDWAYTDTRIVFICAGNTFKINYLTNYTSGDLLLTAEQCTDPDNKKHIVAHKSECVLLTKQRYPWVKAVHACLDISDVDQWQIIEHISGDKQTFLERFLHEEDFGDEVWIGLRYRSGVFEWNSAKGEVDFIPYVSPDGDGYPPPGPDGACYATAGAGPDRVGGGWRGRPCNTALPVLCQTRLKGGTPSVTTTEPFETKFSTTKTSEVTTKSTKPPVTSTDPPTTHTPSRKTSTVRTEISTSTVKPTDVRVRTEISTSSVKPTDVGVRTDLSSTVGLVTAADNSTDGTTNPKNDNTNWINITVAVVVVVFILCATLICLCLHRRRRRQSLMISRRNEEVEYSTPSTVNSSTPFVTSNNMYDEACQVQMKEKTTLYSHIHNTGGADDSTYDTANHKGTQPSPTLNATYDRVKFNQSESPDTGVYDVTHMQTLNSRSNEENPSSTYDHAFVTGRTN